MATRARTAGLAVAITAMLLTAGLAWAAQIQTITLPGGTELTLTATILPAEGGEVRTAATPRSGEKWVEDVDLDIDFGEDGVLFAFGSAVANYDPGHMHTVRAVLRESAGIWRCETLVMDDDLGQILFQESGRVMGDDTPATCTAAAEVIFLLDAS